MFIDSGYIENLLLQAKQDCSFEKAGQVLDKAERVEGLSHEEVAMLLVCSDKRIIERVFKTAEHIRKLIYGNRIVLFAPIYVSDFCVNRCSYCNYNFEHGFQRRRLTMEQIRQETRVLQNMGHRRLALEAGEDDINCPIDYILECLGAIYSFKSEKGSIRRINVNIAATSIENYRKLKLAGIGTYILFQETYHKQTYEKVHTSGPKKDFDFHLSAFERAMAAGLDDVGAGVLFGLHDPFYEIIALLIHNQYLEKNFGVGFHTISVPRICSADGALSKNYKFAVDDDTFLKLVAILRIAIPFTGMIISTRENANMRKKLIHAGVSQISGGSNTKVGGYSVNDGAVPQFDINDVRNLSDISEWLLDEGLIPSFCTACYRSGRTGDRFMNLAKSGEIKNACLPNALVTLAEYARDFGSTSLSQKASSVIKKELLNIEGSKLRSLTASNLDKIKNGGKDLFI